MLAKLLFGLVAKQGNLTVTHADGKSHSYGDGRGPKVSIRIKDWMTELKLFINPKLALGEAYVDERLTLEKGNLYDFLEICVRNVKNFEGHPFWSKVEWLASHLRFLRTINPVGRARRNVAHHYDLKAELYDLFLDEDKQYSCAYFRHPDQSLEAAQSDKKRHLAAKLLLDKPGLSILDIGSGWGGLGLYLARTSNAELTGLTLSTEQHRLSNARAAAMGLADKVRFLLQDYRLCKGTFDRIVSVGMFEHVGPKHYRQYFRRARALLKDDGVMVLHSIGSSVPAAPTNPWITKYIFPGGHVPSLSEVIPAIEKERLVVTDLEVLHLHYAETLRHWRERFNAQREKARKLYDERFCRMWDFYLAICELGFRFNDLMVFQVQLAKTPEAVPWRRDYIYDWERREAPKRSQAAE